ncbi:MAG: VTT domain-containing protein [Bryobacteraceae bacterium]
MSAFRAFFHAAGQTLLAWGPWGAFVFSIIDSGGLPAPEGVDVLLVTMAALDATTGYLAAGLAVVGSLIGSLFLFYLGRKGGEAYLDKKAQTPRQRKFRRWFQHYGGLTLLIPTLIPIPLPVKIFVLSAGALGMKRSHFVLILVFARTVRYFALAYLGAQMGRQPLHYLSQHRFPLLAISVGLFLVLYLLVKWKDRRRAAAEAL